MAKPNYQFEKRQRDLAKKAKQEEKRQRKLAGKTTADGGDPNVAADSPDATTSSGAGVAGTVPDEGTRRP